MDRSHPPRPASFVFLPTLACNCSCSHCFEEPGDQRVRREEWAPIFAAMQEIATRQGRRGVRVYWQGGEVLCLPPDDVAWGLEKAAEVFDRAGIEVEHQLQTNLLLYDRQRWRDVLRRFGTVRLGTSLDHPNLYRRSPSLGAAEYEREWLRRKQVVEEDGFRLGVITLPNPETLRLGASHFYQYFADVVRPDHLLVNLPFRLRGELPADLDLTDLGAFLVDLYDVWVGDGRRLPISPFRGLEQRFESGTGSLPCIWSANCAQNFLALGPAGVAAQCDCWLTAVPDHEFGSVLTDGVDAVLTSPARRRLLDRPVRLVRNTNCGECRFWGLCHGGCPIRAYAGSGTLDVADLYCPVYESLFRRVLEEVAGPQATRQDRGS